FANSRVISGAPGHNYYQYGKRSIIYQLPTADTTRTLDKSASKGRQSYPHWAGPPLSMSWITRVVSSIFPLTFRHLFSRNSLMLIFSIATPRYLYQFD